MKLKCVILQTNFFENTVDFATARWALQPIPVLSSQIHRFCQIVQRIPEYVLPPQNIYCTLGFLLNYIGNTDPLRWVVPIYLSKETITHFVLEWSFLSKENHEYFLKICRMNATFIHTWKLTDFRISPPGIVPTTSTRNWSNLKQSCN